MLRTFRVLPFLFAVLVAGCRSGTEAPAAPPAAEAPVASEAAPTGNNFDIVGGDDMRFSLTAFTVAAGDTVTVTLHNGGALPKETFGHNFVLLGSGVDVEGFLKAAADARSTDFIPASGAADVLAHTRLLGAGEKDTVTFTAPTTPGVYPFVCSFPGHGTTMRGTMTVTAAG